MARQRQTKNRKSNRPYILAMALIGVGLLVLGVVALVMLPKPDASAQSEGSKPSLPSAIPAQVDFPAPEVSVRDLEGNKVKLSDYQGQTVLLNNWATWCPPCRAEMPTLQAYYEDHRDQNFTIVAIESGEPPDEVAEFVAQNGLTFPVLVDRPQLAIVTFRNNGLPNSYLIDPEGQVRLAWNGAISREMLEKYVTPLLEN